MASEFGGHLLLFFFYFLTGFMTCMLWPDTLFLLSRSLVTICRLFACSYLLFYHCFFFFSLERGEEMILCV